MRRNLAATALASDLRLPYAKGRLHMSSYAVVNWTPNFPPFLYR
jgi:hypothetical protein